MRRPQAVERPALELSTRLVLPAHPSSLRLGRHATLAWLQFAPRRYDKDTVLLLVTEVLANALGYSRGPIVLSVAVDGQQLRVEVADSAPAEMLAEGDVARLAEQAPHLKMTTVLADRWGVDIQLPEDGRGLRVVWFECRPLVVPGVLAGPVR